MEQEVEPGFTTGFQLRDIVAIVRMQWRVVLGCTLAAVALALLHGMLATRMYKSTVVLHLLSSAGQEVKVDRVVDSDQYNRWNRQIFVQTELDILRSRQTMTKVLQAYEDSRHDGKLALHPDEAGITELLSMMEIDPRQGTELLDLSITSPSPDESAILANLVAETYKSSSLARNRVAASDAKVWLGDQIEKARRDIATATAELIAYQKDKGLEDADQQVSSSTAQMDSLNQAMAQVKTDKVMLESRVWSHEKLLKDGDYRELAKDLNSPLVVSLTSDYADAVTQEAQIAARYGEKMPERREAEARLQRIEDELKAEVEVSLSAERKKLNELYSQEKNLQEELDKHKAELMDVSEGRSGYDMAKANLDRAKDLYVKLTQRNDELELQAETQLNNVQIVDQAIPVPTAVEPRVMINVALALVAGLVVGFAAGLGREYLDDTISSPLEVQTFLRAPFLGMIPKISDETDETALALYTHRQPRSSVAEAMRAIRTVLELHEGGLRRILVTSAVSAEGKTATVMRLGVAFANLGKRVIVIDADLRRPRIHKIFGIDKEPGLSSAIHGTPLDEVIRHCEVPNLDFLPSGRGGERPNELLASVALQRVLAELDQRYDLVLIDSPPTVLLSDARILSRVVDGVVVMVREHTTSRMLVREAIVGLEQVKARVLGVIVNAVDLNRGRTSYKYYYGYGYGYGYGYRYDRYYRDPPPDDEPAADA
jgi:capsular exopolysaccharide synthesis family protein